MKTNHVCPQCGAQVAFNRYHCAKCGKNIESKNDQLLGFRQRKLIQTWLLATCIAILSLLLAIVPSFIGNGQEDIAEILQGATSIAYAINGLIVVFITLETVRLASSLHYPILLRILLVLFCLIPFINLVISFFLIGHATRTLRNLGYRVGFLGADMKQFEKHSVRNTGNPNDLPFGSPDSQYDYQALSVGLKYLAIILSCLILTTVLIRLSALVFGGHSENSPLMTVGFVCYVVVCLVCYAAVLRSTYIISSALNYPRPLKLFIFGTSFTPVILISLAGIAIHSAIVLYDHKKRKKRLVLPIGARPALVLGRPASVLLLDLLEEAVLGRPAGARMVLPIKGVEFPFRWCPAGTFTMGSPAREAERKDDETQHRVTLSRGFWMLETQVTQEMWEKVTGSNPSYFKGAKLPVEKVSWDDCQEYITKLNAHLAGTPGAPSGYRFSLPTEAQWEYACRAGTTTAYHFGNSLSADQAHFNQDWVAGSTKAVGSYPANAWGLKDMHGNVREWCLDWYYSYPSGAVTDWKISCEISCEIIKCMTTWYDGYPSGAVTDPTGASSGLPRVLRGGSWDCYARYCRSAYRNYADPSSRSRDLGIRISLVRAE